MVAAVYYFGTAEDHEALLAYLDEPAVASLHPWPIITTPHERLSRGDALARKQVMVTHELLGPPVAIRPGDRAMKETTKAGIFNRLNWSKLQPTPDEGLIDSNASPVLFWRPASVTEHVFHVGDIGSQADAMSAISDDYERWVKRVLGWVRRKGMKVWGEERDLVRPELDIELDFVNAVYALPRALLALESGAAGRR